MRKSLGSLTFLFGSALIFDILIESSISMPMTRPQHVVLPTSATPAMSQLMDVKIVKIGAGQIPCTIHS
jgi:hypothetical protein